MTDAPLDRIEVFACDASERPAVLVLPGGGYQMHADHEGTDYARWLNGLGYHAFVLRYAVAPSRHPQPVDEAWATLSWIRDGDHGVRVSAERVGVIGSSAGGHLAACLSTGLNQTDTARPAFAILCYPVISFNREAHLGSVNSLLGDDSTIAERRALSLELRVDAETPPTFVWATAEDEPVPVWHSLAYYDALVMSGVAAELHVFPHGPHGLGLAPEYPHVARWAPLCADWLAQG